MGLLLLAVQVSCWLWVSETCCEACSWHLESKECQCWGSTSWCCGSVLRRRMDGTPATLAGSQDRELDCRDGSNVSGADGSSLCHRILTPHLSRAAQHDFSLALHLLKCGVRANTPLCPPRESLVVALTVTVMQWSPFGTAVSLGAKVFRTGWPAIHFQIGRMWITVFRKYHKAIKQQLM